MCIVHAHMVTASVTYGYNPRTPGTPPMRGMPSGDVGRMHACRRCVGGEPRLSTGCRDRSEWLSVPHSHGRQWVPTHISIKYTDIINIDYARLLPV